MSKKVPWGFNIAVKQADYRTLDQCLGNSGFLLHLKLQASNWGDTFPYISNGDCLQQTFQGLQEMSWIQLTILACFDLVGKSVIM